MYLHIRVDRHPLLQFMDGATFESPVDTAHLIKGIHKSFTLQPGVLKDDAW